MFNFVIYCHDPRENLEDDTGGPQCDALMDIFHLNFY